MRIRGYLIFLASLSLVVGACAGTKRPPPPSTDIDEVAFRDHLRILAADDFEGRKPGTVGQEKTVTYLVDQFRKLGLQPGNGTSYLQQVPLLEILTGVDTSLSVSGANGTLQLAYGKDMIIWSKQALPQSELHRSDLVFVGYGIVAPEYAWNDYADVDVHGKTVVILANDPGFGSRDPKIFKGGAMTYYGRWAYKIEEATRQGAAGVLLIHDPNALGYGWSVVQNTWMGAQLELAADGTSAHAVVEGWIQKDAAQTLFAAAGQDFAAITIAAARSGFKAIQMNLQVDATVHSTLRQFDSPNVVAQLPGAGHRRECVIFTAHWDHLGRDLTRSGHNIFNGAVDNASGVAGLLTLAQSFVRTKPAADRTIVFLALTGAESGLLGSEYYVQNPIFSLRETAAALNLDGLRNGGPTRDLMIRGFGNTDLEDTARAVALLQGRDIAPEVSPERGLYYFSDNFSFAKAGVPALYAGSGLDDTARGPIWGRQQFDDYMDHRFHQPTDQYSPAWDVRGAINDLSLYYDVGNRVARKRQFPRWYPRSEFRVSRVRGPVP